MSRRQSGQAAVETALTLPLVVFMVLGSVQLFMVNQARILAQYSLSRAAHVGSLNNANCLAMRQAAVVILMPAINARFAREGGIGATFAREAWNHARNNRFTPGSDDGRTESIVWLDRVRPLKSDIDPVKEEDEWNAPDGPDRALELRMVFWAPLKIPFANWVFHRMALAHWGLRELHTADPLMPVKRDAKWVQTSNAPPAIRAELLARYDNRHFAFPVEVTYATKMMSPVRFSNSNDQNCPR